jgi:hypothetical protein
MTQDEFISLVRQPELVAAEHLADLKDMVDMYPYFAPARLFHAKALQRSNSILFGANLKFSSLYSSNRRWLYYYIYPDKKVSAEPYRREKTTKSSGDYFDMINIVESEGGDAKQTLKTLAERLKSARSLVTVAPIKLPQAQIVEELIPEIANDMAAIEVVEDKMEAKLVLEKNFVVEDPDFSEDNAKKLIREHKYMEAIEILRVLNLNNPKKSVYFADQIRFLEKVIANSKK